MQEIAFVNPPYERVAPGYEFVRAVTNRSPSLGLLHLAAMAREHGYCASILERDAEALDVSRRAVRPAPSWPPRSSEL